MKYLIILIILCCCSLFGNSASHTVRIIINRSGSLEPPDELIDEFIENKPLDLDVDSLLDGDPNKHHGVFGWESIDSRPKKIVVISNIPNSLFDLEVSVFSVSDSTAVKKGYVLVRGKAQDFINNLTDSTGLIFIKYRIKIKPKIKITENHRITFTLLDD